MFTQDCEGSFNKQPVMVLAIKNLADLVVYVSEPFSIMSGALQNFGSFRLSFVRKEKDDRPPTSQSRKPNNKCKSKYEQWNY